MVELSENLNSAKLKMPEAEVALCGQYVPEGEESSLKSHTLQPKSVNRKSLKVTIKFLRSNILLAIQKAQLPLFSRRVTFLVCMVHDEHT